MNRDAALRKLKACLRLSKSSNANEAALALRHAQRLMQEFSLDESDADDDAMTECMAKTRSRGGDVAEHVWQLAATVAKAFQCKAIQINMTNSTGIAFFGRNVNTKIAEYSYAVLRRQLDRDIAKQIKLVRKAKNRAARRYTYGIGWVAGVASMLDVKPINLADLLLIETLIEKSYGSTKQIELKKHKALNVNDFHDGFTKGKTAQLNTAVEGAKQKQLEHAL